MVSQTWSVGKQWCYLEADAMRPRWKSRLLQKEYLDQTLKQINNNCKKASNYLVGEKLTLNCSCHIRS